MGDGLRSPEVLLHIRRHCALSIHGCGSRDVLNGIAHQCSCAVGTAIVQTVSVDVVDDHARAADQSDGGSAGQAAFGRADPGHTEADGGFRRLVQQVRPILRVDSPGEGEPGQIQSGGVSGFQGCNGSRFGPAGGEEGGPDAVHFGTAHMARMCFAAAEDTGLNLEAPPADRWPEPFRCSIGQVCAELLRITDAEFSGVLPIRFMEGGNQQGRSASAEPGPVQFQIDACFLRSPVRQSHIDSVAETG